MISIIVAIDENFGIGKNNSIPWRIPDDLSNFRRLTTNNVCIMGKNTWKSLPSNFKPLPSRKNIIVSTKYFEKPDLSTMSHSDVFCACSLEHAIGISQQLFPKKEIFIIGGAKIYEESLLKGIVDRLIITHVYGDYNADVSFPKINLEEWECKRLVTHDDYTISEYT